MDIITADPHSEVAGELRHFGQRSSVKIFRDHTELFKDNPYVLIPDAGAIKKADSWLPDVRELTRGVIQGLKHRDTTTGDLAFIRIDNFPEEAKGNPIVIIDDICDGGGTFNVLAKICLERGASEVRLGVTHGLFTKGLVELQENISFIATFGEHFDAYEKMTVVNWSVLYDEGTQI